MAVVSGLKSLCFGNCIIVIIVRVWHHLNPNCVRKSKYSKGDLK